MFSVKKKAVPFSSFLEWLLIRRKGRMCEKERMKITMYLLGTSHSAWHFCKSHFIYYSQYLCCRCEMWKWVPYPSQHRHEETDPGSDYRCQCSYFSTMPQCLFNKELLSIYYVPHTGSTGEQGNNLPLIMGFTF